MAIKPKNRLRHKGIQINLIKTLANYEASVEGNVVCYDRNKAKAIKVARQHIEKNIAH